MCRVPYLLPKEVTVDDVEEKFWLFQSTSLDDGILSQRADEAWRELDPMASGGGSFLHPTVMPGVIFHSRADCESAGCRVFSSVIKNKCQP